jgi:hypothetical protein
MFNLLNFHSGIFAQPKILTEQYNKIYHKHKYKSHQSQKF